ncbi:protein AF-10 isoform X2 [Chironomus tepperi]|uniref:protein AF-10 isoform X2 n=1 Tax=Chironomus tepperi TaxID=113505 RepID=UPI00391FC331
MKEMVGGCCVCSDERGWPENPLVYCDGQNCTVAVHQACYGIVTVPTGPWYCRKCESQERSARVRCELCPSRDGALKKTDNQGWAHVVCALYIPEVRFGNVSTMEPIILALIPAERYNKSCYICVEMGKGSKANVGACMQCNKSGCKQQFHVTCAQQLGLLCEEAGNYLDNVKYCGYCQHHYSKLKKGGNVKPIPPYKPISHETNSSDSPSSPEKESEMSHSTSRSNRPTDPLATTPSLSSSSKQKKSSNTKNSSSSSNVQIPYSGSSNAPSSNVIASSSNSGGGGGSSRNSSSSKDKDGKHSSSSSSKNVNKISSSTNKHDKDPYSSYSSRGDKNKSSSSSSSSSSSKSSHQSQNVSNKDDGVSSNSHNSSKSSSQFSTSTTTIRITTSSATPTSPVSTIIHKHDGSSSTLKDNVVQSSINAIMSSQVQNSSKLNDDTDEDLKGGSKMGGSSWHQNSMSTTGQKLGTSNYSSGSGSLSNSEGVNDTNDANKANYSAMTKKRKAMHQANSSNRNSADENVNKDICKDLSVKVVPIDKFDPSVSEFERHYKKARTDLSSQSTPAAATTQEPNIQNVNPNVIHSSSSTTASSVSTHISSPPNSGNNKSQVITQNIHLKNTSGATAASLKENCQAESLVVSVPLSATTVPGIQMPTNSSNNPSNSSTVSTIVQMQTTSPMSSVTSSSLATHGSLYQHLTNNQTGSQRASPLVQQQQQGGRSASPLVPTTSSVTLDNSSSNHTSVLQNMNSTGNGGSVISSTGYHGSNLNTTGSTSTTETSPTMLKVQYEKQPQPRIHAIIQQEESGRRSSNNARNQSNHKTSKNNAKNNDNSGAGSSGVSGTSSSSAVSSNVHTQQSNQPQNSTNNNNNDGSAHNTTTTTQSTIVKLSPAPSSTGSARTSSPIVNATILKKFRDDTSTSRTPDVLPFSALTTSSSTTTTTPTAGGLKFGFEPQNQQQSAGLVINTNALHHALKESPPSSPGSEASARKRRKATIANSVTPQQSPHAFVETKKERDDKDPKTAPVLQNGGIGPLTHHHMLGNQLNPASTAAKNMTETLSMEIEAHSIYTAEPQPNFTGPQYPGRKDSSKNSSASSSTTSSGPASITSMLSGTSSNGAPQSLEQLLERQWEQGSQFLMEQAQHFDIASLLSCLHQLKIENSKLEDHINSLISRRDHLLAVNARLAIPLSQPTTNQVTHNGPSEVQPPPPTQPQTTQQPQTQSQPMTAAANKRTTSNVSTHNQLTVPPMENGLDYRGHHSISSSNQIPSSSSTSIQQNSGSASNNIRHSPAMNSAKSTNLMQPTQLSQIVTMDGNQQQQQQQQQPSHPQFSSQHQQNAQFQPMYQQQQQSHTSNVNSMRSRQNSSYQTQQQQHQATSGSVYPTAVHKTKN